MKALKAQHIQTFYDSFILLACRARNVPRNAATLDALLVELEQKDTTDYAQIDANIVSLVRVLNAYPEVTTIGSCGGHRTITNASQWQAGSWYVKFEIAPTEHGWYVLEFLAWAINEDFRHTYPQVTLLPTAPPPYLNAPGNVLSFVIECFDGPPPDELAESLEQVASDLVLP